MGSFATVTRRRLDLAARPHRRGSIALFCAIAVLVLIGLVGLALDTAMVRTTAQELQRTADAAALAGAARFAVSGQVDYSAVRQAAHDTALANSAANRRVVLDLNAANDSEGDIVVGAWNPATSTFQPTDAGTGLPAPDALRIRARFAAGSANPPLHLLFGPLFGVDDSNVGKSAIARRAMRSPTLVLVLDPSASRTLSLTGSASLSVLGGSITVNSSADCALRMTGPSMMIGSPIRIVGTACADNVSHLDGTVVEGVRPETDPLVGLPDPGYDSSQPLPPITGSGTYNPGYYPGGISLSAGTVTLNPGVYVIGGQGGGHGISISGTSSLLGDGITLFFLPGAGFQVSGGTVVRMTAPSTGTFAGVSAFFSRSSSSGMTFTGTSLFDLQGTVYIPRGVLTLTGGGSRSFGRLIADQVTVTGGGSVNGLGVAGGGSNSVFLVY